MRETYETPGLLALDVRLSAGSIEIDTAETGETEVELEPLNDAARELIGAVRLELRGRSDGHELTVAEPERRGFGSLFRGPQWRLRVRCPHGAHVEVRSRSADVLTRGRLGAFDLKSASSDASVDEVEGPVRVHSASGDLEVRLARGPVEVNAASGDLLVGCAHGSVRTNLVSGDVTIREALGPVETRTVSGDQRFDAVGGSPVSLQSVSGDLYVAVVPGRTVWIDAHSVSGDTHSSLDVSGEAPTGASEVIELRAKSVSGDIQIARAD